MRHEIQERFECQFHMRDHGWITWKLSFFHCEITIWISDVFDCIPEIIELIWNLESTSTKQFQLQVDEEGHIANISLDRYGRNPDFFLLRIRNNSGLKKNEYDFRKVVSLSKFRTELKSSFLKMVDESKDRTWRGYSIRDKWLSSPANKKPS